MTETVFRAYTGIALAFLFSISFLYLLVKTSKTPNSSFGLQISLVFGLVISVALVGDAQYVSLIQGVVISLGCLGALIYQITRTEKPDVRVTRLLIAAMIVTLLLGQAARSFRIGILDWFKLDVGKEMPQQPTSAMKAEIDDLSTKLDNIATALSQQLASTSSMELKSEVQTLSAKLDTTTATLSQQVASTPATELKAALQALSTEIKEIPAALSQQLTASSPAGPPPSNAAAVGPVAARWTTVTLAEKTSKDLPEFGFRIVSAVSTPRLSSDSPKMNFLVLSLSDSAVLLQTDPDSYIFAGNGWKFKVNKGKGQSREFLIYVSAAKDKQYTLDIIPSGA